MSKKHHILVDLDEVVFVWLEGFYNYLYKTTGLRYYKEDSFSFDLSKVIKELDKDKIQKICTDFQASEDFGELPLMKNAVETLKKIHGEGYEISIISSFAPIEYKDISFSIRDKQIKTIFGDTFFTNIDYLCLGEDKYQVLDTYKSKNTIFLDDSMKNIEAGQKAELTCVLFTAPYNKEEDFSLRANTWEDFYNIIKETEKNV